MSTLKIERRSVTSSYHGSKISGFQLISSERRPLSNDRRNIWATVLLLSAIIHSKVIHRWPKRNMRVCMGKIEFET